MSTPVEEVTDFRSIAAKIKAWFLGPATGVGDTIDPGDGTAPIPTRAKMMEAIADGVPSLTGDNVMMGANSFQQPLSVANGTSAQHAVNKGQLDTVQLLATTGRVADLTAVKTASFTNINVASPGATIGGYNPANGERVLLGGQTAQAQNRPWQFNGAAVAMTIPADCDSADEMGFANVEVEGTTSTYAGNRYQCSKSLAQINAGGGLGTVSLGWNYTGKNSSAAAVSAEATTARAAETALSGRVAPFEALITFTTALESGWLWVATATDEAGKKQELFGVRRNNKFRCVGFEPPKYSITYNSLSTSLRASVAVPGPSESGYVDVVSAPDETGVQQVVRGVRRGTGILRGRAMGAVEALGSPCENASYFVFAKPDKNRNSQVWSYSKTTHRLVQLTSVGSNSHPWFTADGRVAYLETYQGRAIWRLCGAATVSSRARFESSNKLALWGDSLTRGPDTPSYGYYLGMDPDLGVQWFNGGIGGQRSAEICKRWGSITINLSIDGGSIPASGPVTITSTGSDFLGPYDAAPPKHILTGTMHGASDVHGTVARDAGGAYTFTRDTAGSVVVFADGSVFEPDTFDYRERTCIFYMGTNEDWNIVGTDYTPTLIANVAGAIAFQTPIIKKFLIIGVHPHSDDTMNVGSLAQTRIAAYNAAQAATYGDQFIDLWAWSLDTSATGMLARAKEFDASIVWPVVPGSADDVCITTKIVPPLSLLSVEATPVHWTIAARRAYVKYKIKPALRALGFIGSEWSPAN